MSGTNVLQDGRQFLVYRAAKIFVLYDLPHLQGAHFHIFPGMILLMDKLPHGFQHSVGIPDAVTHQTVDIDFKVDHHLTESRMLHQLTKQPVVQCFILQQNIQCTIAQMQVLNACIWAFFVIGQAEQILTPQQNTY